MIKKAIHIMLGLLFVSSSFSTLSATSWKVFVYMDASDDLNDMAIKNISNMMRAQLNDTVDFVIQLHAYGVTALRYRLMHNSLIFMEEVPLSGNSKQDFIQAMQWAFADNQADHTMLIAWNHGWGILDPQWNEDTEKWEMENDAVAACPVNRSLRNLHTMHRTHHKGFMFSVHPRTYLTNQDLIATLRFMQDHILQGKKVDVLAFDTCMGAMIEVAYQVAPYAHYFVGNETCSMRDGFNYQGIIAVLNQEPSPRTLAQGMVEAFNAYYAQHDDSGIYTHTALDLTHMYEVKESLDAVLHRLQSIPQWPSIAFKACEQTPRVCIFSMYPDLVFFCKKIEEQLMTLPSSEGIIAVQQALHNLYNKVQETVIARCGGSVTYDQTFGIAIYQPFNKFDGIDSSYYKTLFGCESPWITLLEHVGSYAKDIACHEQNIV